MRVARWQEALDAVFAEARSRRFRWGTHDCIQFAARSILAIAGEDRRKPFPRYQTRAQAQAILETFGGARGILTRALGEPVHRSRATSGDIVLIDMGMGEQAAVCMGLNSFAPGRRNLEFRPTATAVAAWVI